MAKKENEPWYKDGLKFKCSGCGDCCTGAPGYVWFNREEGKAIAKHLDLNVDDFYLDYARKIGIRHSLKEFSNGDCVFFDNKQRSCQIYEHRPAQCRTWPFWSSNLKSKKTWEQTCKDCPGSGTGKLYSLEQIEAQRKVVRV